MEFYSYDKNALKLLHRRDPLSHKSTYGRVVVVGGCVGMCGAAYLSAKAAYRTGAGLVDIITPEENRTALQTLLPEAIITAYDSDSFDKKAVSSALSKASVIVVGVGMGTGKSSVALLKFVLKKASVPLVIDADALNIISADRTILKTLKNIGKKFPVIITPHIGEMSRLTHMSIEKVSENLPVSARDFAIANNVICVLKSHNTVVFDGIPSEEEYENPLKYPSGKNAKTHKSHETESNITGDLSVSTNDETNSDVAVPEKPERCYSNNSGNAGMATGGSGDALTGIIAALVAGACVSPCEAASLGVYIHGLAGDAAAEKLGEYSVMASDIIDAIPAVLKNR